MFWPGLNRRRRAVVWAADRAPTSAVFRGVAACAAGRGDAGAAAASPATTGLGCTSLAVAGIAAAAGSTSTGSMTPPAAASVSDLEGCARRDDRACPRRVPVRAIRCMDHRGPGHTRLRRWRRRTRRRRETVIRDLGSARETAGLDGVPAVRARVLPTRQAEAEGLVERVELVRRDLAVGLGYARRPSLRRSTCCPRGRSSSGLATGP